MDSSFPLPVLYSDEHLLAVNKPAGLLTIRDGYLPDLPYAHKVLENTYGRLWTVHRLDKDTSGILVFARTPEAHRHLNLQFETRQTLKEYRAVVYGSPDWTELTADAPLRVNGDRRHRTVVDLSHGKPALTAFSVLERFPSASYLSVTPHSGYTHQIRAHLAASGFPILFDLLYNPFPYPLDPLIPLPFSPRLALHAFSLRILHPVTGENLALTAPLPDDFQSILSLVK